MHKAVRVQRVLICIQARSTSKRLPNKGQALIGQQSVIQMILDSVDEAIAFMRRSIPTPIEFHTALLIPTGDALRRHVEQTAIVEGDEADVLSRFQKAFAFYRPDYLVRITGDSPMLPDYVIGKHIRSAIYGNLDYCTNADERYRTAIRGHDVEVMSKSMMRWLFDHAVKPYDREHVTSLIHSTKDGLGWAKLGYILGHADLSDIKLSIDTQDDLERVRVAHKAVEDKIAAAKRVGTVFRL